MFFGEERVDRGRADLADPTAAVEAGRDVGGQVPDGRVVARDQRQQALDRRGVRSRKVDVTPPDPAPCSLAGVDLHRSGLGGSWTMITSQSPSRLTALVRL